METEKIKKRLVPIIDYSRCNSCGSCVEVCPEVFHQNSETGFIEVTDRLEYPEECVQEAMAVCPGHCIMMEESY